MNKKSTKISNSNSDITGLVLLYVIFRNFDGASMDLYDALFKFLGGM